MRKPHLRATRGAVVAGSLALTLAGCALDVTNPNAATEEQVLTSAAGMRALVVGLQGRLGNAVEEATWVSGLVSGELGNTNASQSTQREFQRFPDATANSAIEETNPDVVDLWSKHYAVVRTADDILDNVDGVTLAPGTRSGMTALARTAKALAFGTLVESYEQIVLAPDQEDPQFVDRAAALTESLALLASARADLAAQAPSAEFLALLAPGFDLPTTISALQARYSLAAGAYANALAFANEVPPAASSAYSFTATDPNPLRQQIQALGYFGAIAAFRANAEAGDARVDRYTTATATTAFGGASLVGIAIYRDVADPIPIFRQEELTLIRAEANARLSQLGDARTAVNAVRAANGLPAIADAGLPTQDAVLAEVYRQRTYSLFLTGLHWADQRRFGRLADAKVAYLPYPLGERATNPNTPANP